MAHADCDSECGTASSVGYATCGVDAATGLYTPRDECGANCQDAIDNIYSMCDCQENWEASKPAIKATVEALGCAGASSATPALFVGIAAVLNHFLN